MANGIWNTVSRMLKRAVATSTTPQSPTRQSSPRPSSPQQGSSPTGTADLDDFHGRVKLSYAPVADGHADPGEVVWAWVPYEEDHTQGKDRPVLVIARHDGRLLGLMLTSKDHDRDAAQEARHGRVWMDLGSGAWDRQGRPSEVRLDRILQLRPEAVRREGAVLEKPLYDEVAAAVRTTHGW